jgi:hypothetical protein
LGEPLSGRPARLVIYPAKGHIFSKLAGQVYVGSGFLGGFAKWQGRVVPLIDRHRAGRFV